jgi:hypothetical protein
MNKDAMSRCNSSGKILLKGYLSKRDPNTSQLSNCQKSMLSATSMYLDRRHNESKEKVERMRLEKFIENTEHLKFTPTISKNSRKIIENISKREVLLKDKVNPKLTYIPINDNFRKDNNAKKKLPPRNKNNNSSRNIEEYKKIIESRETMLKERDNPFVIII